ncbi:hypothetical protein ASG92_26260 [Arthrobacter sp. Soil736]|uniref:hypothetical protein n=1 Tax=Arthrobacter sp. Soil736 TaxID=1736395 RepID=UPI0006F1C4B8|nr:hypothetical protein [Arthrobacter sp. Soil736]KRE50928.1 hypothetical protein ASG92_26260 [Arthrobacter sp. Soil736]
MTNYRDLTKPEAAAALQEFLDEREPALARLRELLVADGQDPAALLDGTPESFVPLWRWLLSRLNGPDAPGATDPASMGRLAWPSWERYTTEEEGVLSFESLTLLDGLVSYLAAVVKDRAPAARWEIARSPIKRYVHNNHPVLVSGAGEKHNFLPGLPMAHACGALLGVRESPEDAIAVYARRLIEQLNEAEGVTAEPLKPEPLVEVEDIRDEAGGYDFEIGLGEELAHERSADVDRLVRDLSREDGVKKVLREDRDMILVRAPSWSSDTLQAWILRRF